MADKNPSAYELFVRFAPKFREVKWKPVGFRTRGVLLDKEHHRFDFYPENMDGVTFYGYHGIDISAAGANLDFTFKYDATSSNDMTSQMLLACWGAVLNGPLKGRKFYVDPLPDELQLAFEKLTALGRGGELRLKFSLDGEPIPGLDLVSTMKANHWTYFVPRDSAESKVIEAALQLEQAHYRQSHTEELPDVTSLAANLEQALQTVA